MRLHFIPIPVFDGAEAESELNRFLATHRIVALDRQLVTDGPRSAWAVCASYVYGAAPSDASQHSTSAPEQKPNDPRRIDYRDTLPPAEFQVFAKLRALRKTLSDRDGVPSYALFTNDQLAQMVKRRVRTLTELGEIDGIGPARLSKYGQAFLSVLHEADTDELKPADPPAAAREPS